MVERKERRAGGSWRLVGLAALIGVVALAIAWFGNCIPGFGAGGSFGSPSSPEPASKATSGPAAASAVGVHIVVDGERCRRGDAALQPCDALCSGLADEPDTTRIEVDGTLGTHAAVDGLRKCLAKRGLRNVVVRAE